MSPPAGRMCAPGRVAVATSPPSTSSASSIGTTASAPGGSGAPVAMPDAEPAGSCLRRVAGRDPERDRQRPVAQLGSAHRVAVHGRGRERRQRDGRMDVRRQHAPDQAGAERQLLHVQAL